MTTSAFRNASGAEIPVTLTVAGAVPVTLSGETITMPAAVEITNDAGNAIPVSGPLTDTQLRASAVPVVGTGTATTPAATVLTTRRPAVTQVLSTALEASRVLKASAGQLVQLAVFNSKAAAQYILLINATALPADGAVTLLYPPIPIAANSLLVLDLPAPLVASTGIVACNSSTGSFTKTLGAADCAFYAQVN